MTEPADRDRYEAFMNGLVDLIVDKYDGSLKAEHGTGRNMAPYVAREWGEHATELMWQVKALADPDAVLNPDSVLSRDPSIHLDHLKSNPPIEEAGRAHLCVECGFCEPVCPSRDLTTTPRQRIVVRREIARQPDGSPVARALLEQYVYDGEETCAVDGSCLTVCPLGIDTGALIKDVRARSHTPRAERMAANAAKRYAAVERAARAGLRAGGLVSRVAGDRGVHAVSDALRRVASPELVPEWSAAMPRAAKGKLPPTPRDGAAAVYLPACINRIFGGSRKASDGGLSLPEAVVALSRRAGRPVWIPPDAAGTCCATPWSSKGYKDGHAAMAAHTAANVLRWTDGGKLPLLIDATSCAHGLKAELAASLDEATAERWAAVEVIDPVAWCQACCRAWTSASARRGSRFIPRARRATSATRRRWRRSPPPSPTTSSCR